MAGAGKSVNTAVGAAGAAVGEFALTSASKGLVSAIMAAYSWYGYINMCQARQYDGMTNCTIRQYDVAHPYESH